MSISQVSVAKNTTYLTAALVVQKVISFTFFLVIARTLGDAGTGDYVAAFSLSSIFAVFVDLGFAPVLTRELARHPEQSAEYLRAASTVKLLLAALVFAVLLAFVIVLNAIGAEHPPLALVAVAGIVMVIDSFALTVASVFRGWQNLWYEAAVVVLNKVFVLGLGYIALQFFPSSLTVGMTILVGSVMSLFIFARYLKHDLCLSWRLGYRRDIVMSLWREAVPFALAGIFAAIYSYSDTILLAILQGSEAVGQYSVASKTMNAFQFIPSAFMAAVFPAMSNLYDTSPDKLLIVLEQSMKFLLVICAPLAVGLFVLADEFVLLLGQDFSAAAAAVRILMPSMIFMFLSYPLGSLLNASRRQHWQTAVIGGGMVLNIALNIWLVPRMSYIGASWSWFAANIGVFMVGLWLAHYVVAYRIWPLVLSAIRVGLAAGIMVVTLYYLLTVLPLFVVIGISGLIYCLILFISAELTLADMRYFWSLFIRRNDKSTDQLPHVTL